MQQVLIPIKSLLCNMQLTGVDANSFANARKMSFITDFKDIFSIHY